jgi:hypothetical protein
LILLCDENLGKIPQALALVGYETRNFLTLGWSGKKDIEWLPWVGQNQQLFFACDTKGAIYSLRNAGSLLKGLDRNKLRCYVLLAFNGQTTSEAQEHLENVWQAGFMPFAQLYQPPNRWINYSLEWRDLARKWSRPAIMKTIHKLEIENGIVSSK